MKKIYNKIVLTIRFINKGVVFRVVAVVWTVVVIVVVDVVVGVSVVVVVGVSVVGVSVVVVVGVSVSVVVGVSVVVVVAGGEGVVDKVADRQSSGDSLFSVGDTIILTTITYHNTTT